MLIVQHFTQNGAPVTGLTPNIKIWNVSDDAIVVSGLMTELSLEGNYIYDFSSYDASTDYIFQCDGGATLSAYERYASFGNPSSISSDTWALTVSGLDGVTISYSDMIQDLFTIQTGKWEISGSDLILYELDSTTELIRFTLDSVSSPQIRTPQ